MSTELIVAISSSPLFAAFFAWIGSRREKKASARRSELKTAMDEISVYNQIIEDLRNERKFHYDEMLNLKEKLDLFTSQNKELLQQNKELLEQNKQLINKLDEIKKNYSHIQKSYSSLQKSYKSLESDFQELLNQNTKDHEQQN